MLFLPVAGYNWSIPVILFFTSFILSFFAVAFSMKTGKKRVVIIRYLIAGLVAISVIVYITMFNNIIGKVDDVYEKNGKLEEIKINVITGKDLLDMYDSEPEFKRLNNSGKRDSIFYMDPCIGKVIKNKTV
jgi:hypothetical protein